LLVFGPDWKDGERARKRHKLEEIVAKLCDELLNGEIFFSLLEGQVLIEAWRRHYNGLRLHSSLNYRPPAPESFLPPSGGIVPWVTAPAVEGARSLTPNMASEAAMH
jgi:putative transposase